MTTREQAKARVSVAEQGCIKVFEAMDLATKSLAGQVTTNGIGVFRDPARVRHMLQTSQTHIQKALQDLDAIEWPSEADYDYF